jgi:hypothetical protein
MIGVPGSERKRTPVKGQFSVEDEVLRIIAIGQMQI